MYRSTESYLDFGIRCLSFSSGYDDCQISPDQFSTYDEHKRAQPDAHLQPPLLLCPVVHTSGDHIPPRVHIGQIPSKRRTRRRQSQHDRRDGDECVVYPPGFVDVPGLEGDLETTTSHTKGHGVHVDVIGFGRALLGLYPQRRLVSQQVRQLTLELFVH